jgi:hypothetical protein
MGGRHLRMLCKLVRLLPKVGRQPLTELDAMISNMYSRDMHTLEAVIRYFLENETTRKKYLRHIQWNRIPYTRDIGMMRLLRETKEKVRVPPDNEVCNG